MASELEVGTVKAATAELNATDYHLKLQDGAGNPWYLRAPDGSLRMHLNNTGDIMTFDSSGNVGVGIAPDAAAKLDVNGTIYVRNTSVKGVISNPSSDIFDIANASGGASNPITFSTQGSERMRVDSSGNILIGKTVTDDTETGTVLNATQMRQSAAGTVAHDFHDFYRGTAGSLARVGHIRTTGTATSYNTSSDYRLKENLEPLTGALDRIDQLPVYRFNFTADPDTTVDGFVAHEVSAHVPEAVTGEKDAMKTVVVQEAVEAQAATYYEEGDELPEGKAVGDEKTPAVEAVEEVTEEQPDYQGIDQSKLVPLLVAAVKELKAKVEALEGGE